jgi:hypothetical protein
MNCSNMEAEITGSYKRIDRMYDRTGRVDVQGVSPAANSGAAFPFVCYAEDFTQKIVEDYGMRPPVTQEPPFDTNANGRAPRPEISSYVFGNCFSFLCRPQGT